MNLLLVFSDTHGNIHPAETVINAYPQATHVLHLGDYASDAAKLAILHPNLVFLSIAGNCDFSANPINAPSERHIEIGGKQIYMTHGHRFGVKEGLGKLQSKGKQDGIHLVLFGHTHIPFMADDEGMILFNPGSTGQPRYTRSPTFGLVEIGHGLIEARILEVP